MCVNVKTQPIKYMTYFTASDSVHNLSTKTRHETNCKIFIWFRNISIDGESNCKEVYLIKHFFYILDTVLTKKGWYGHQKNNWLLQGKNKDRGKD